MKNKNILKLAIFILLLAGAFWLVRHYRLIDYIIGMKDWIKGKGFEGIIIFTLIYIAGVILAFPGTIITALAGAIYGTMAGTIIVSIASTIGVSISFFIARYFARDAVLSWISRSKRFAELDAMVEKNGPMIIAVTRLIPLFPFNILNYGFGVTKVRFFDYFFWSWLCMLPGTILYIAGADAFVKAAKEGRVPWLIICVIAAMLVLIIFAGIKAKKMIGKDRKEGM